MPSDLNEFLFEHYKQDYQFQLERTDAIRDRVSFVVGFLTVLGGILSYFMSEFPHAWHCGRTLLFYVPLAASAAVFVVSVSIVLWVVGGPFRYQAIPSNPKLQEFADDLAAWGSSNGTNNEVVMSLKESLLVAYRDGAHHNFLVNRRRTDRLLLATRLTVLAFLLSAGMLPAYIFERSKLEKEPTLVRLVSSIQPTTKNKQAMEETNNPSEQAPANQTPQPSPTNAQPVQQQAVTVSPKPKFPPNQLLSEGSIRMETKPVDSRKKQSD